MKTRAIVPLQSNTIASQVKLATTASRGRDAWIFRGMPVAMQHSKEAPNTQKAAVLGRRGTPNTYIYTRI